MPLIRRQTVLVKSEGASYGVDPVHAATDAQLLHDVQVRVNSPEGYGRRAMRDLVDRARVNVLGRRSISLSFSQEMRGNAADLGAGGPYAMFHDLLVACGFSAAWSAGPSAWIFSQAFPNPTSVAVEVNQDGLSWLVLGCRGNARMRFRAGERAWIDYDLMGRYAVPSEVVIAAPDYADDVAPVICQTLAFHPYAWNPTAAQFGHIRSLEIDLRRNVVFRDSLTLGSEGLGVVSILAAGSEDDPGVGFTLEVEQQGTGDATDFWWSRWAGQTLSAGCSVTLDSGVAGNRITVSLARLQILSVEQTDMEGRWGHRVSGRVLSSAAATTDDAIIVTAS